MTTMNFTVDDDIKQAMPFNIPLETSEISTEYEYEDDDDDAYFTPEIIARIQKSVAQAERGEGVFFTTEEFMEIAENGLSQEFIDFWENSKTLEVSEVPETSEISTEYEDDDEEDDAYFTPEIVARIQKSVAQAERGETIFFTMDELIAMETGEVPQRAIDFLAKYEEKRA
ncbi:MAG: hypothetical protein FWG68_11500 [Defluviitaleaceae bacterium]|nr:hypothetical protein [Defluviitaleaceae bacterium]